MNKSVEIEVMDKLLASGGSAKRVKRADQIVEAVKRWVVVSNIQAGERLSNEKLYGAI